ncbi:GumC family protein [Gloeobacter kilaueensis]|uniref:Lipopolysaccharide biosynthesis protein n=1 Tax=Gloeobacter kilaueensis (strain ATCC BAA-2537 / CCAP 1431/1 / ULC 316 / JS1) TaxID=1183438 RepID=U5QMU3_GLOK1|nr:hypothetical protein [Gloeobacter kilaueensis]AGY60241.1 hypothetical protein GKIL_3995 [Gloeobacter kilaueensis JS1]
MTKAFPVPELPRDLGGPKLSVSRHLLLGLAANVGIWGLAAAFLVGAPRSYTSEWALILPGSGMGTNITLADVGQASSSVNSPYASSSIDPRANYKAVAESEPVLQAAAKSLGLTARTFGQPRIKLPDQSSVIEFALNASTPELAQKKSRALEAAFEKRLDQLRTDEMERREASIEAATASARQKLQRAQQAVLRYKAHSGLSSTDQVSNLTATIEQLHKEQAEVLAQGRLTSTQLAQLTQTMKLSPGGAADAFVLQADQIFQEHLKDYSEATTALQVLQTKWGANHPTVAKELARREAAHTGMIERARALLGSQANDNRLQQLSLMSSAAGGGSRENLFRELVATQAQSRGLAGQAEELTRQIAKLETKLRMRTAQQTGLEGLQRNLQLAETVFTSTLAKLDVGKSDIYASYPLAQQLIAPQLPEEPSFPSPLYTLLGALVGSFLVSAGIFAHWLRGRTDEAA